MFLQPENFKAHFKQTYVNLQICTKNLFASVQKVCDIFRPWVEGKKWLHS
jgi:hypothetical protein